jgi:hypothetical protein
MFVDIVEGEGIGVCCLPASIPVEPNRRTGQNPAVRYGLYLLQVGDLLKVGTDVDLFNDLFPSANGQSVLFFLPAKQPDKTVSAGFSPSILQ